MRNWRAFCEVVHITALALWLGVLCASGLTAATIFPAARALKPVLPDYAAYSGEHALIIGGQIAQNVFLASDAVMFICALLAMLTLGALVTLLGVSSKRPAVALRIVSLSIALACATGSLVIVNPALNSALRHHWDAAKAGDTPLALKHKMAADELHPTASRLLAACVLAVMTGLVAGVWSIAAPSASVFVAPRSRYEEPDLLKASGSGVGGARR